MSVIKKTNYFLKSLKEKPIYTYSLKEWEDYNDFIEKNFGKIDRVYHEIYSPDVHIDILMIKPTPEQNYYKLITRGVGAYKMNIPEKLKEYELERAELIMYLPPSWNMSFSKGDFDWVVKTIKIIGRLPIELNSWICAGHSITDDGETPFSKNTKFSASILLHAENYNKQNIQFRFEDKGKINFYQIMPLYKEEYFHYFNEGLESLFNVIGDYRKIYIADNNRPNTCLDKIKEKETVEGPTC